MSLLIAAKSSANPSPQTIFPQAAYDPGADLLVLTLGEHAFTGLGTTSSPAKSDKTNQNPYRDMFAHFGGWEHCGINE